MNFEDLQQNWRSQPIASPADRDELKTRVASQWQQQQRKLMWSNIAVTIAFVAVLVNFAWIYASFHEGRTLFFSGSLVFMTIVLLVYLWIMWRGLAFKKDDATLSSIAYIDYYLHKLRWRRKTITTYLSVYSVLLWLALMLYCIDVTRGGTLLLQIAAPLCITAYIFGLQYLIKKTKRKKQLRIIDDLITELEQLRTGMTQ